MTSEFSAETIRSARFREKLRGYHPEDVDRLLDEASAALERLTAELAEAKERASRTAESTGNADTDDSIRRMLVLAQRTADLTIQEADREAQRIIAEAHQAAASQGSGTAGAGAPDTGPGLPAGTREAAAAEAEHILAMARADADAMAGEAERIRRQAAEDAATAVREADARGQAMIMESRSRIDQDHAAAEAALVDLSRQHQQVWADVEALSQYLAAERARIFAALETAIDHFGTALSPAPAPEALRPATADPERRPVTGAEWPGSTGTAAEAGRGSEWPGAALPAAGAEWPGFEIPSVLSVDPDFDDEPIGPAADPAAGVGDTAMGVGFGGLPTVGFASDPAPESSAAPGTEEPLWRPGQEIDLGAMSRLEQPSVAQRDEPELDLRSSDEGSPPARFRRHDPAAPSPEQPGADVPWAGQVPETDDVPWAGSVSSEGAPPWSGVGSPESAPPWLAPDAPQWLAASAPDHAREGSTAEPFVERASGPDPTDAGPVDDQSWVLPGLKDRPTEPWFSPTEEEKASADAAPGTWVPPSWTPWAAEGSDHENAAEAAGLGPNGSPVPENRGPEDSPPRLLLTIDEEAARAAAAPAAATAPADPDSAEAHKRRSRLGRRRD